MPKPLSADIRSRFRRLFDEGLSGREIGRRLMISAASASRLAQKIRRGVSLAPAPNRRKTGRGRLAPFHDFLIELIHQDPDITLRELTGALEHAHGVRASISARSNSAGKRRLDLGGMTGSIPMSVSKSRSQFASNARSARNWPQATKRRGSGPVQPGSHSRPRQCGAMIAHCVSLNVVRIKATSHLVTLNQSPTDLGILKRQQTLVHCRHPSPLFVRGRRKAVSLRSDLCRVPRPEDGRLLQ
jgi:transposase